MVSVGVQVTDARAASRILFASTPVYLAGIPAGIPRPRFFVVKDCLFYKPPYYSRPLDSTPLTLLRVCHHD